LACRGVAGCDQIGSAINLHRANAAHTRGRGFFQKAKGGYLNAYFFCGIKYAFTCLKWGCSAVYDYALAAHGTSYDADKKIAQGVYAPKLAKKKFTGFV
jgi:hypothetical protein